MSNTFTLWSLEGPLENEETVAGRMLRISSLVNKPDVCDERPDDTDGGDEQRVDDAVPWEEAPAHFFV